jgi:hypothetical protein
MSLSEREIRRVLHLINTSRRAIIHFNSALGKASCSPGTLNRHLNSVQESYGAVQQYVREYGNAQLRCRYISQAPLAQFPSDRPPLVPQVDLTRLTLSIYLDELARILSVLLNILGEWWDDPCYIVYQNPVEVYKNSSLVTNENPELNTSISSPEMAENVPEDAANPDDPSEDLEYFESILSEVRHTKTLVKEVSADLDTRAIVFTIIHWKSCDALLAELQTHSVNCKRFNERTGFLRKETSDGNFMEFIRKNIRGERSEVDNRLLLLDPRSTLKTSRTAIDRLLTEVRHKSGSSATGIDSNLEKTFNIAVVRGLLNSIYARLENFDSLLETIIKTTLHEKAKKLLKKIKHLLKVRTPEMCLDDLATNWEEMTGSRIRGIGTDQSTT